jgi:hypothetical protein
MRMADFLLQSDAIVDVRARDKSHLLKELCGPRHFIMDRLASGDVTSNATDIQGVGMRVVATMNLSLLLPRSELFMSSGPSVGRQIGFFSLANRCTS